MVVRLSKERSFRFELVNVKTGTIINHFNLIYPPETYTIKEAPRHSIMKLFSDSDDNTYIDDFGDDNKIITLRGTTGSPEELRGYKDGGGSLSGQEAILRFRKDIINWRAEIKRRRGSFADYVIKLYNLFDEELYLVFITNFQVEKASSKPLFYVYNMEMITISPQSKITRKYKYSVFKTVTEKIESGLNILSGALDRANEFLTDNAVVNALGDAFQFATFLSDSTSEILESFVGVGTNTLSVVSQQASKLVEVAQGYADLINVWYAKGDDEGWILPEIFHPVVKEWRILQQEVTNVAFIGKHFNFVKDKIELRTDQDFEEYYASVNSSGKANENVLTTEIKQASGKTSYEVAKLARDQYGVDFTGPEVADFNDLSELNIPDGTKIVVPISETIIVNTDNQILTIDKAEDKLGADIRLDDGKFVPDSNGDLSTVVDINNMKQAVTHLLETEFNAFIALDNYGFDIKNTVGKAGVSDFISTVRIKYIEAISRDPRVVSVDDLKLVVESGKVEIDARINLIAGSFENKYRLQ